MTIKAIIHNSVFRPIPKNTPINDVLATLFHRSAATVYAIYCAWAIIAFIAGLPTISEGLGLSGQLVYSVLTLATAAPACIGATFWPNLARTELIGGSAFVTTIVIYLYFILQNILFGEGSWAGLVLILSVAVLPAARTVIVIILLLRQAKDRKAAETALLRDEI